MCAMCRVQAKESWEMSDGEKVEAARVKKDKAAAYFKAVRRTTPCMRMHRACTSIAAPRP